MMKDIYLTSEQIQQLKVLEPAFETVTKHNYKRGTTHKQNEMLLQIWNDANNTNRKVNWGCTACVMQIYKDMAQLYDKSVEKQKEEEITKELTNPILIPEKEVKENQSKMVDSAKSKKRGRPRKNNN